MQQKQLQLLFSLVDATEAAAAVVFVGRMQQFGPVSRAIEAGRTAQPIWGKAASLHSLHPYTLTHLHSHTVTHLHTHTLTHLHTYTLIDSHTCTLIHSHTYTLTHLHTCTLAHLHACTHTHLDTYRAVQWSLPHCRCGFLPILAHTAMAMSSWRTDWLTHSCSIV